MFQQSCRACKSLKSEWYSYLESSGFEDIEDDNGLKGRSRFTTSIKNDGETNEREQVGAVLFNEQLSYYQWARTKINDGRFDSEKSRLIWEYHAEGYSTRQISPIVGLEQSWCVRKIKKAKEFLKAQDTGSGSFTLDLFFWAEPWKFIKA